MKQPPSWNGNATPSQLRKRRRSEETSICIKLVDTINQHRAAGNAPNLIAFWHTPNGGKRSKADGGLFKAMGVLPGVPDYAFMYTRFLGDRYRIVPSIAFLEMKDAGGKLSPSQQAFNGMCVENGVPYGMARSVNEAITWLEGLGIIGRRV